MLALPVSSAECERVFSSAKLLITDRRSRLKPDIIEANECLKARLRDDSTGQNRQSSVHEGAEEIDLGNGDETDEDGSESDEYDDDSDDDSDGEFGDEEHVSIGRMSKLRICQWP
jgi:hAT family C-terminal dimerisation region